MPVLRRLFANSRFYILLFSLLLSGLVYQWSLAAIPDSGLRSIRLEQVYGFLSVIYLYIAVMATPLLALFAWFPGRAAYMHARRAIGVAAFYFAALHVAISFFGQLQGFAGIGFLTNNYGAALLLGLAGLLVLFLMAATSLDYAVKKLTFPRWKRLHRLVYPASLAILVHVVMIGTHFSALNAAIPRILIAALAILLLLEAVRIDTKLRAKWPKQAYESVLLVSGIGIGLGLLLATTLPASDGSSGSSLSVHNQHLKIASDIQKRYTVSFAHGHINAGQEAQLEFKLYDATNGSTDFNLQPINTKLAHLVIVDDSLTSYQHIHPLPGASLTDLAVNATFPHPGNYRLYLTYQPSGAIEQQVGFSLAVGGDSSSQDRLDATSTQPVDSNLTKIFDDYKISLRPDSYSARKFTLGQQKLSFSLQTQNGTPVTNLYPYLGSFGHLVLIEQTSHQYIHVHPYNTALLADTARGGPTVDFLPIGLYGAIKPGTYRVFAEFNPNNKLVTADFTIRIAP